MRVLIAVLPNAGSEPEALRQVLESFGCLVLTQYIGRPNDFIAVLGRTKHFDPDVVILSGHGENGAFIMPVLGSSVYTKDEPKGNFSPSEINQYLTLADKTIVSTCCTTGTADFAAVFSKKNVYIAPDDYIESNAVLLFMVDFFYQMIQNSLSIKDAWNHARSFDEETARFAFYEKMP